MNDPRMTLNSNLNSTSTPDRPRHTSRTHSGQIAPLRSCQRFHRLTGSAFLVTSRTVAARLFQKPISPHAAPSVYNANDNPGNMLQPQFHALSRTPLVRF